MKLGDRVKNSGWSGTVTYDYFKKPFAQSFAMSFNEMGTIVEGPRPLDPGSPVWGVKFDRIVPVLGFLEDYLEVVPTVSVAPQTEREFFDLISKVRGPQVVVADSAARCACPLGGPTGLMAKGCTCGAVARRSDGL